jgi:hypothetical protein
MSHQRQRAEHPACKQQVGNRNGGIDAPTWWPRRARLLLLLRDRAEKGRAPLRSAPPAASLCFALASPFRFSICSDLGFRIEVLQRVCLMARSMRVGMCRLDIGHGSSCAKIDWRIIAFSPFFKETAGGA